MRTKNFSIGKGGKVDKSVILGYKTGRKIKISKTVIGKGAVIRSGTVIYSNTRIGDKLETGHSVTKKPWTYSTR